MRILSVPIVLFIAIIFPVWKAFQDELADSHIIKWRHFNGKNYMASNEMENKMIVNDEEEEGFRCFGLFQNITRACEKPTTICQYNR
jgi:hypothetical protein